MKEKLTAFFENAKLLNDNFNITPLMFGSLGLSYLIDRDLNPDDIDILIPEIYLEGEMWDGFKKFLEERDYILIDLDEHTFRKNNIDYSYASIENLKVFAGIEVQDIKQANNNPNFLLLELEQYLKVYEKSSLDGYRMNKKFKADYKKIEIINELIISKKR